MKTFYKIKEIRVIIIDASVARTEKIQGLQVELRIPSSKRKKTQFCKLVILNIFLHLSSVKKKALLGLEFSNKRESWLK